MGEPMLQKLRVSYCKVHFYTLFEKVTSTLFSSLQLRDFF